MSKILVFNGSPHKKGTTAALLAETVRGIKDKGAEVLEYNLNDKELRGCQGCNACRKEDADTCVIKDYLQPMYDELREADGIVLGSPIYVGTFSAQTWLLLDRLVPAMAADYSPRLPGKKYVTLVAYGTPVPGIHDEAIGAVHKYFQGLLGWEQAGEVLWAGAGGELPEDLKNAAYASGQSLVQE